MFPTERLLLQQQYGFGNLRIANVHSTYRFDAAGSGFRWMSVDRGWVKILNSDNDLRRSLAFGGSPWKVEVERVKGITQGSQPID